MPHIYRWDLDKTYLATEFESVSDLIKTAFQSAEQKCNIPGTAALMRGLRSDPLGLSNQIYVVSGSPRQMRKVVEEKLRLDGVQIDHLTLKPNLRNVLLGRFRAVRDQLGYKLPVLLESRARIGTVPLETCFGDDAEMDGLIYRLYSDLCARRVVDEELSQIMEAARLYADQKERIRAAIQEIPIHDPVERILIHLETGSPTQRFESLGPRVVPTFNSFQSALVLLTDKQITVETVMTVVRELKADFGYDDLRLQNSMLDLIRRRVVDGPAMAPVCQAMALPSTDHLSGQAPTPEAKVDYVARLDEVRSYRRVSRRRVDGIRALLAGDD